MLYGNTGYPKRVVRDALKIINYLILTLIKTAVCPDILNNASIHEENDNQ